MIPKNSQAFAEQHQAYKDFLSNPQIEFVVGGEKDFLDFLNTWKRWDKSTIRHFWNVAVRKKYLLILRPFKAFQARVFLLPLETLPKLKSEYNKLLISAAGWVGGKVEPNKIYIFGQMIQDQLPEHKIIRRRKNAESSR